MFFMKLSVGNAFVRKITIQCFENIVLIKLEAQ